MASNDSPAFQATNLVSRTSKPHRILRLPGDGVGPEMADEAITILSLCSIDAHGTPSTDNILQLAKSSDAILFSAIGGPKWREYILVTNANRGAGAIRPEAGLLTLLSLFAILCPWKLPSTSLTGISALRSEIIFGIDFVIVREDCGSAYFGQKVEEEDSAIDPWAYSRAEIERVARVAAKLACAMGREKSRVKYCDEANVLASSRLWRKVVTQLYENEFSDIKLSHQLADSAAMLMMKAPTSFNGVVVTENTFGDILSDVASVVPGSLGLLPSASLGGWLGGGEKGKLMGLYEAVHRSVPGIAGKGIVNPAAMILSVAMILKYSFGMME
ncbi:putative 3-isopropylmalate dehydrogenase [Drepanopeziza brunnea f. sp. 'multigermtubi' MB_m1]|uniref:3-isopropylmalate dehydrogenase n=1 Tax=Marssonina brunnea f. sp. multigermtubi (strain MB_m1) TaxID=1072389 RepID=K1XTX8_MARBU|nr:putative 3-isopropylmalate dehydrogenase [Drepanopeziza brunnea f. sp. 'multigermtubi' MB_m1]EKD16059.1 putative 3-isopropylmalate dehydrogenase [Drepanopeziza brunnea f. sp. 'multigermtubi' MB_m1]